MSRVPLAAVSRPAGSALRAPLLHDVARSGWNAFFEMSSEGGKDGKPLRPPPKWKMAFLVVRHGMWGRLFLRLIPPRRRRPRDCALTSYTAPPVSQRWHQKGFAVWSFNTLMAIRGKNGEWQSLTPTLNDALSTGDNPDRIPLVMLISVIVTVIVVFFCYSPLLQYLLRPLLKPSDVAEPTPDQHCRKFFIWWCC